MTRSLWKGPFIYNQLEKKFKLQQSNQYNIPISIWARNSTIIPEFIGKSVLIHNGRSFQLVKITNEMIGHKFGEFAYTRKKTIHKKTKK